MSTSPQTQPPGPIHVGDYTLLARIGEGGMGVVHLARRSDGHRVALKVLRPHIVGDDEARERLAREVNSLSRIRSRWVAEIEDADPYGPIPYVATRYVPGLSLHDHVHEDGPIQDLTWFAGRLADGLHAVHAVGVLHRDVKPSNVLMEGRAPILIDFGLARVADDPRLTHTGWLLGTPGYLAPEILHGADATTASDVHSWAATVAFAGTGRAPFGRGPSMAIMDRVRRGEHDLTGLAEPVRELVAAALAPEAHDRPTLAEIRGRLSQPPPAVEPTSATAVEPILTMPLAAVPLETREPVEPLDAQDPVTPPEDWYAEQRTDAFPDTFPDTFPDEFSDEGRDWPADPYLRPTAWLDDEPAELYPAPPPADLRTRLRRSTLTLALLAVVGVGMGLAPYVVGVALFALAWLLRAGSLAASSHVDRRFRRGRRWYDAFVLPISYPWFFVVAFPGLVMLACWSAGLALAAGLICFAFNAPLELSLVVTGTTLAASMWWGPGGSRFRGPVRRVVDAASDRPLVWVVGTGVAVLAAIAGAVLLGSQGVDWTPASSGPFADGSVLRRWF